MKKLLLLGTVFLMVLFAGCVGGEQPAEETGDTTEMGDEVETGDGTVEETTETGETEETTEEVEEPEEVDMVETLADALAQSVPMECTSSYTGYDQVVYTTHFWIKGENVRYEADTPQGTSVVIVKDDVTYISTTGYGEDMVECDWIIFETEDSEVEQPDQFSYSTEMLTSPEKYNVECHAAVFGDEKFDTPGNTCTWEDIILLPMEFDECSGLTGEALTDCLSEQYQ